VPRAVRVCSMLLSAAAALGAAMLVAALLGWRHFTPAAEFALADEAVMHDARTSLAYTTGVAAVGALVTGGLAWAVRRRRRWVQPAAWCALVVLVMGLLFGLGGSGTSVEKVLYPSWYPGVIAVLDALLVAVILAAAVALSRTDSEDFHRPDPRRADPRWEAFGRRQAEQKAGPGGGDVSL
jgi:hypothetical protein